jgi:hypothetical protein
VTAFTYIGIDPGQHGAVAALRLAPQSAAVALRFGHGRDGYHGPHLAAKTVRRVLAEVIAEVGGAGHEVIIGIEALGKRPGEGVRSTSTAGENYGVWQAVLDLDWEDQHRVIQTQTVDRAMGLPRGMGKVRKGLVIVEARAAALRLGVPSVSLVPPGGRAPSDGAADALLIALALQRGL